MNARRDSARPPHLVLLVLAVVTAIVAAVAIWAIVRSGRTATSVQVAYRAQLERNFMAIQRPDDNLTYPYVRQLAQNYRLIQLAGADAGGRWMGQAKDARSIVAINPTAKVYAYYRLSYMGEPTTRNVEAFDSGFRFPEDWYLHDTAGRRVLFISSSVPADNQYFVDLSNAHFRAWLVATVVRWMRIAPWAGLTYDTAEYIDGRSVPIGGNYPTISMNDLLCGRGVWDATGANCPKVAAWNAGLQQVISDTAAALHPLRKDVLFNGIAPPERGQPNRMLDLLSSQGGADGALDESFCFRTAQLDRKAGGVGSGAAATAIRYTDVLSDIAIMRNKLYADKKLLFESNYIAARKLALAHYCIAAFLMGWQPGRDFYRFAQSYNDNELATQPDPPRGLLQRNGIDELDLNLGYPIGTYSMKGNVLSRRFDNGFVVVNLGHLSAYVKLPPMRLVQFSQGRRGAIYRAGGTLSVSPHEGVFFLTYDYLHSSHS